MKKLMTLCFFAFAMVLGTQTIVAQSMVEVNAMAATKTKELKHALKLNNDIEEKVYITFQEYVQAKASLEQMRADGETVSAEAQAKFDNFLIYKFRDIFSDDQMERYKEFAANQK